MTIKKKIKMGNFSKYINSLPTGKSFFYIISIVLGLLLPYLTYTTELHLTDMVGFIMINVVFLGYLVGSILHIIKNYKNFKKNIDK